MPGSGGCYEHVGARFLNECDTAARRVATAGRTAVSGLDGAPHQLHDQAALNVSSRGGVPGER
jgi:hypothetical protein